MTVKWLRKLFEGGGTQRRTRRENPPFRPMVEPLEDRTVPTQFTVQSLSGGEQWWTTLDRFAGQSRKQTPT
jgi:hypothetical protein